MAEVSVADTTLRVRFRGIERVFLGRARLEVPIQALRHVETLRQPLSATRGGRAGFAAAGLAKIGYWGLGAGVRQLVSATRRPGVRIVLDTHTAQCKYDELIISHPDNENLAGSLARASRQGTP